MSRTSRVLSAVGRRLSGAVAVWVLTVAAVGAPILCQEFQVTAHHDALHRQAANEAARMLCRWHADGRVSFHRSADGHIYAEVHVPADDWASLSNAARDVVRADVSSEVRWHGEPIYQYVIHDEAGALLAHGARVVTATDETDETAAESACANK